MMLIHVTFFISIAHYILAQLTEAINWYLGVGNDTNVAVPQSTFSQILHKMIDVLLLFYQTPLRITTHDTLGVLFI